VDVDSAGGEVLAEGTELHGVALALQFFHHFGGDQQDGLRPSLSPAFPAAEPVARLFPSIALSRPPQVLPGWTISTSPCNDSSADGDKPLNVVSHSRGSPHDETTRLLDTFIVDCA